MWRGGVSFDWRCAPTACNAVVAADTMSPPAPSGASSCFAAAASAGSAVRAKLGTESYASATRRGGGRQHSGGGVLPPMALWAQEPVAGRLSDSQTASSANCCMSIAIGNS